MLAGMSKVLDALWRAIGYCFMPRVIFLSMLPVLLLGTVSTALAWFFWEPAAAAMTALVVDAPLLGDAVAWLDRWTGGVLRHVIGPLLLLVAVVPVLIIAALLLVSALMAPTLIGLVGRRRFEALERRGPLAWWRALGWTLGSIGAALAALVLTLPLWLIPPLALLLPPLILGWLTYRVMAHDVLAEHADAAERAALLREHRAPLLAIGVTCGYLGAAPSLIWAFGVLALPMAPLLLPVYVWLYTLVEVFAALWFAHYMLAALDARRQAAPVLQPLRVEIEPVDGVPMPGAPALPSSASPSSSSSSSLPNPPLLP